jgi:hypothetical protein
VKYTTRKPIQLPRIPIALYELININGKNSYLLPKMIPWKSEQYAMSGIAIAMYSNENRSRRKIRDWEDLNGLAEISTLGRDMLTLAQAYQKLARRQAAT